MKKNNDSYFEVDLKKYYEIVLKERVPIYIGMSGL